MRLLILLLLLVNSPALADQNFDKQMSILKEQADASCLGLIPIGVCPKAKHVVGALVLLKEPSLLIQTFKKSSGVSSGNLQFNEVHVLDNPLATSIHQSICSDLPDSSPPLYYMSELDAISWRQADLEKKLPQSIIAAHIGSQCQRLPLGAQGQCMRSWGPLYPRTGYVLSPSSPLSSAISAVRAVSIAQDPTPSHLVTSKLNDSFNIKEDKLQMIKPKFSAKCISIGQNPSTWEQNNTAKDGQYVWFYWNWRLCCI